VAASEEVDGAAVDAHALLVIDVRQRLALHRRRASWTHQRPNAPPHRHLIK
jgi:hypothetical protein